MMITESNYPPSMIKILYLKCRFGIWDFHFGILRPTAIIVQSDLTIRIEDWHYNSTFFLLAAYTRYCGYGIWCKTVDTNVSLPCNFYWSFGYGFHISEPKFHRLRKSPKVYIRHTKPTLCTNTSFEPANYHAEEPDRTTDTGIVGHHAPCLKTFLLM